jgi:ketosteroid isomerase-like protein
MDGPGPTPLEVVVAHDEIRQLASRYAVAVDSRDLDRLVGLFVDDVRVGRDTFGRDALRDSFRRRCRRSA